MIKRLWGELTIRSELIQVSERCCCLNYKPHHLSFSPLYSNKLHVWQVQTVCKHHDSGNWLPAEEECGQQPLRLGQHGQRVPPALQQPGLQRRPAGAWGFKGLIMCQSNLHFIYFLILVMFLFTITTMLYLLQKWKVFLLLSHTFCLAPCVFFVF